MYVCVCVAQEGRGERSVAKRGAVLSCSVVSDSFDPMDCSPPSCSVHGDSPGKNTEVGWHALFQGIFPNQRLNPGLPPYHLKHQGNPGERRGTSKTQDTRQRRLWLSPNRAFSYSCENV